jgi:hypothetical protein
VSVTPETIAAIAEGGTLAASIFGFGIVNGRLRQRVNDLEEVNTKHETALAEHAAKLSDGSGEFKLMNYILANIKETVDKMAAKLDKHCDEDRK